MKDAALPLFSSPADVETAEDDLVRAALAGDAQGWAGLIARHNHRVVVSLLAHGMTIDRARDLAQETWLRLIERQRAGRLPSLVLPGLAIVQAGFLASNEWRSERRGDWPDDGAVCTPAGGAESRVIDRQELDRVAVALAACAPTSRRVFEFVYEHPELTYAEAALRLGLSRQRVKQIVCEVRKRLRDCLAEEAP
jgi:RNA polymerase sigma-70 factor (ECF subfamily)